jgi:hypothetical protein
MVEGYDGYVHGIVFRSTGRAHRRRPMDSGRAVAREARLCRRQNSAPKSMVTSLIAGFAGGGRPDRRATETRFLRL